MTGITQLYVTVMPKTMHKIHTVWLLYGYCMVTVAICDTIQKKKITLTKTVMTCYQGEILNSWFLVWDRQINFSINIKKEDVV